MHACIPTYIHTYIQTDRHRHTDRQRDVRQMGDSDFIGHCPTNAGCPISSFYCCENMDG